MDRMLIMVKGKSMKAYQLGLYEKAMPKHLTWEEKFFYTKVSGFDYLEISIDETDEKLARLRWNKAEREAIIQAMIKSGVHLNSMCLSGHRKYPLGSKDKNIRSRSLQIMEQAVDLASDLGIRIIQLAGYDVYYDQGDEETKANFIHNLGIACEMAARKGIMMGFETMETPFMDTVSKSMEYVHALNHPYLGVYPDIGNLTNASLIYGTSVNDDILTGCGHIVAAHLKETVPGAYREIPFGTGHTQFVENIQILKELGVRLYVGEFWYIGSENWENDLKEAATFLREKLDKVFI